MTPFHMVTSLFLSGLATISEPEHTGLLRLVNIELEDLDHNGRRSTENNRKRLPIKPVAFRKSTGCSREPGHLATYSFGSFASPYGMSM
ncbi:hypothetical protein M3J09_007705 [Ascochyta lentis]